MTKLSGQEIADRAPKGWVYLPGALRTRLRTGTFAAGLELVNAIGAAAEEANHHPDLDLRYTYLDVTLVSHDVGEVTARDLRLAATISELATRAGVPAETAGVVRLELGLDSPAFSRVLPFWQAVLGLEHRSSEFGDELSDPGGLLPSVWFQESGDEEPRQRWHPDLWVDPSEVRPRIDAAIKAGGSLVSDAESPSFWVLADPEGNRVCLCTWQERK
ncbi:4a-hydroxytetrahydrobiopterin dehydratase [Actinoplanes sp. NPDC051861]|uniref:4a-hydroxytetrahydrobiopterin dehydratase n=1 Tax=Actinoplanes sp. NPDC051861 TaxID=3155170 RepID=UPI003438B1D2